jgi:2',3'-cyclic-nucleotide 2'-phosphodiesterase (5'-nucleotidase family)
MKKMISLLLALVLLVSCLSVTAFAADSSYAGKTVILYTGNIRGDVSVYPRIKAARDAYLAAGADVVLVDTGNYLQGSAAANTDRGAGIYTLMDAAGYDVAAMGLAEFGYTDATTGYLYHGNFTHYYTQAELQNGAEALTYAQNRDGSVTADRAARAAATFQTVAANVTASDVFSFAADKVVTTASGLKLGFYGLTAVSVAQNVQDGYVSVAAPQGVSVDGADLTICLSNAGVSSEGYGDLLIDVPDGSFQYGVYVIDNATHAITAESLTLTDSDAAVQALAATVSGAAETVIGTSEVILNGADSENRNGETNLGDLVTDALLWYAQNYIDGLDSSIPLVALQNGGNCDNFLYSGDITATDLLRALPFSPMGIGVLYVTGAELLETLEAAAQRTDSAGFAQVAGLTYSLDLTKEYDAGAAYGKYFEADSINRVTITSVGGQPFDENATYAVVCDNYLINGNDTYYTLKAAKEADGATYLNNGTGVKTRDAVALYIQTALGGTIGSDYAAPQNRITGNCTRAQTVMALWNAAGRPEPTITENPFTDVSESVSYYKAVLWALETGVTTGVTETSFRPNAPISRAQVVTFLWRSAGKPAAQSAKTFTDIAANCYYTDSVQWAAATQITVGTSATRFSPNANCTRKQISLFLSRYQAL